MSTDPKTVQAARLLIAQLGLTPQDLMWVPADIPTFAQYVPKVVAASGPGAARTYGTYGTYWTRITETFGDRRLDEVTATDIEILKRQLVANRRIRRNDRGGQSVAEHLVSAMRAIHAGTSVTERPTRLFIPPTHCPSPPLQTIAPPPALALKTELLLATAAIDHSGRIPARRLLRALDWGPGNATSAQLRGDAITLRLDPKSPRRIDSRHHVFVPLGLRDLTGIRTTDHVVLFAVPQEQLLHICHMRVLRSLITDHWALEEGAAQDDQ